MNENIILLGGFGRSGTTGIRELLKGHTELTSTNKAELRILTDPGGFISLKNSLVDNWTYWRGDHAIHEFIDICKNLDSKWFGGYALSNFKSEFCGNFEKANKQFLDDIVLSSYSGIWAKHANIINKTLSRLFQHRRFRYFNRKIYVTSSIDYNEFIELSNKYFNLLIKNKLHKDGATHYIIDEPNISQNPKECMEITGAKKIIVVLRDPRDVFLSFQGRDWTPRKKTDILIFLKNAYSRWIIKKEYISKNSFIEIKFEDIVKNFSTTYNRLCNFLSITPKDNILSNTNYSPQKAHCGRWKEEMSIQEQKELNNYFKELLEHLNYM